MRVLIATDTLSPELTAQQTATALGEGWAQGAPHVEVSVLPLRDGGPGTLDLLDEARGGATEILTVAGHDGAPRPVQLHLLADGRVWADPAEAIGTLRDHGARTYVEAPPASLTGEGRGESDPAARAQLDALTSLALGSSSVGVGQMLAAALDVPGAREVALTLGDLTCHDGGLGLLAALGEADGEIGAVLRGGASRAEDLQPGHDTALADVVSRARARLGGTPVLVASRTDAPLFGLHGANANLSRETGVDAAAAQELEKVLGAAFARVERALQATDPALLPVVGSARRRAGTSPGTGAGGGVTAMLELLGARVVSAADLVADTLDLDSALEGVDLVVTAVPVLDGGVLSHSVPATVGARAQARAVPVVALAQEVRTSARELAPLGVAATYGLGPRRRGGAAVPLDGVATLEAARRQGERLARTWTPAGT